MLGGPDTSKLKRVGGAEGDRVNAVILASVTRAIWLPTGVTEDERDKAYEAALMMMSAFKPDDTIEGMIAAQAVIMHHASMECSRRAMLRDQPFEVAQGYRKAAAHASRTFAELLDTLDRKRGKHRRQVVRVERVNVEAGGQAVVGLVQGGGSGPKNGIEGEPHAPPARLAHNAAAGAVLPALRSANPKRRAMPVPRGSGEG
jgi:hypothetical protein